MNKQLTLRLLWLVLLTLPARHGEAQVPTWQWATSPGGGYANSTVADGSGNLLVAGTFSGTASFGATTLSSAGGQDVFVGKISPAGVWQWAVRGGGGGNDYAFGLALAPGGDLVVAGSFTSNPATFGTSSLPSRGSSDVFVAKLSSAGVWQWATAAGGTGTDAGYSLAVDGSGNVAVAGAFYSPTISFDPLTVANMNRTGIASSDVFVARLSPAGVWQWAEGAGGTDFDGAAALAVDGSGNVFVTGYFNSVPAGFGTTILSSAGGDVFVAKLTPAGGWQWAVGAGGSSLDQAYGMALDPSGNVLVTGAFSSSAATFGATTLTNGSGSADVFVGRLSPTGTWQWAAAGGGTSDDIGYAVAADGSGNVVVTGEFDSPTATFGATTPLPNSGSGGLGDGDVFVTKLSPAGAWQWAVGAGGTGGDAGSGLAVDGSGNVTVTGAFYGPTAVFGPTTLANTAGGGNPSLFIARLANPLGLADPQAAALGLWPNPTHETVRLTGVAGASALLLDATGRVVRTSTLAAPDSRLDLRGLPAGLYVVRCGSQTQRLMVE